MEDKDNIIMQLKAELYDTNKELFRAHSIVNQVAKLLNVQTVEEMIEKLQAITAPTN